MTELQKLRKEFEKMLKDSKYWEQKIILDTMGHSIEKYYYWLKNMAGKNGKYQYTWWRQEEQKAASVFSALFGEMGARRTAREKRAMEMLGTINVVIQSISRILYDLKEYDRLIVIHDEMKSSDKKKSEAARLSAKRVFIDEVDIKKGRGSINQLSAGQLEFVTLRDAFMKAESLSDVERFDLNDRVKRILKDRMREYLDWLPEWEKQLRQQKTLLLNYLKTQHETLRLYTRWIEPYLKNVKRLELIDPSSENAPEALKTAIVDAFDTNSIYLTLFGEKQTWPGEYREIVQAWEPGKGEPMTIQDIDYMKYKSEKKRRATTGPPAWRFIKMFFEFTAKPHLAGREAGAYGTYRQMGHLKITFTAHGFTEEEWNRLGKIKEKLEKEEELVLISAATGSLKALEEDLKKYTDEYEEKEEIKKKKEVPQTMFGEIVSSFRKDFKLFKEDKGGESGTKTATGFIPFFKYRRARSRVVAQLGATLDCYDLYTKFKQAHGFPAFGEDQYFRGI
jgi:hypothetical protein